MGLSNEQIARVNAKDPFLQSLTVPAESYPGQMEPLQTFCSFSFLLAPADLPDNTWKEAGDPDRIHPGARRYLAEKKGLK